MTKDEALKLSLEALHKGKVACEWGQAHDHVQQIVQAMEAIKEALAQPEQEHREVVIAGDLWRIEFLPNNDANVRLVKANYTTPKEKNHVQ